MLFRCLVVDNYRCDHGREPYSDLDRSMWQIWVWSEDALAVPQVRKTLGQLQPFMAVFPQECTGHHTRIVWANLASYTCLSRSQDPGPGREWVQPIHPRGRL